jgi:peroxiredoxin
MVNKRISILAFAVAVGVGAVIANEVRTGRQMGPFALTAVEGTSLTSSNLAGKTLVVWFFVSFDGPSRRQLPAVAELAEEYRDKGVAVFGVSLDMKPQAVKDFAATNQVPFPIAMAQMDFIENVGGLEAVPTTLIVEPHGTIIGRYVGVTPRATLEADIKAILNQGKE